MPAARLPFKRLNTEPKGNQPPKRLCEHACPEPGVSDRENESSPLPLHNGPPLVNGRGPLDGFLNRRRPEPSDENMIVDLTNDDSLPPAKPLVSPASSRLQPRDNQGRSETAKSRNVDHTSNSQTSEKMTPADSDEKVEAMEENGDSHIASASDVDLTKNSDSEPEEQDESGNVSSLGNKSALSNSSVCSSSECSPVKSDGPTPSATPNTVCLAL